MASINKKLFSNFSYFPKLILLIPVLTSTFTCTPPEYSSIEISYINPEDGIELCGTLTIPNGGKNYPAVLLIQGTGPHARDEEILGHKPFRVIADYLSGHGIAVLRVDRRGTGKSGGTFIDLDVDNYAVDAVYGIKFLKSYPGIDSNKIGIIGHSLGGFIAAMVSARTNDAAFIISCGGPGIWGKDIGYSLNRQWAEISGASAEDLKEVKRLSYRWYDLVTKDSVTREEEDEFIEVYTRLSYYMNEDLRRLFYPGPADKALDVFRSPQSQNTLRIDPHSVWSSVHCPVLAINGDKDFQASADENLTAIENGLIAGKNSDYKIVKLKNHNHLFQRTGNGSPAEYGKIKETFSPVVMEVIYTWIDSVTTRGSIKLRHDG